MSKFFTEGCPNFVLCLSEPSQNFIQIEGYFARITQQRRTVQAQRTSHQQQYPIAEAAAASSGEERGECEHGEDTVITEQDLYDTWEEEQGSPDDELRETAKQVDPMLYSD